jgi:tetratricopeptide (TPR) repeat protein
MKKKKHKKHKKKRSRKSPITPASVRQIKSARKSPLGEMGIMGRAYPAQKKRLSIIETLKEKPENERSSDEWWMLGEFQIFEGVMDENDFLVNDGVLALQSGADHADPSSACMLDLGWVLMFKNMDALALPHLKQATELEPASRDAWAFRAVCEIGCNDREAAIQSLTKAISLPGATDTDRNTLEAVRGDKNLEKIRKEILLRKIEPEDYLTDDGDYETDEKIKWSIHVLKGLLELEPENVEYLLSLAGGRYCLNQFEESEHLLLRLIANSGDNAEACTRLALIAKKHRKDRDAELNYYQRALECDPDYLLALVNLASAYQDDGEWYLSRTLLERACQGDNTSAYFPLALDLYGINGGVIEKNFKKEIAFHEAAIQMNSNHPIFFANLICALLCDDRVDEAKVY